MLAAGERHSLGGDGGDARLGADGDVKPGKELRRRIRQPLGQSGQDARPGLDDGELDRLVEIEAVEAKAASSRIDLCSSAASSTPVAPAPTMTQWSWPGRSGAVCALARRQALTMRR